MSRVSIRAALGLVAALAVAGLPALAAAPPAGDSEFPRDFFWGNEEQRTRHEKCGKVRAVGLEPDRVEREEAPRRARAVGRRGEVAA